SQEGLLQKRLSKLLNGMKVSPVGSLISISVGSGFSFSEKHWLDSLDALLARMKPGLVIIDSLIRVHSAEENSATDMARVFRKMKRLTVKYGITIVVADHLRKSIGDESYDIGSALRGSGDKRAFVDTLMLLQISDGALVVHHPKSRYALSLPSFGCQIEDLSEAATVVTFTGFKRTNSGAHNQADQTRVLKVLSDDWLTRQSLLDKCIEIGIKRDRVDEILRELVQSDQIERSDRKLTPGPGGKQALYRLRHDTNDVQTDE
ncbi:MAG: helicase RepA family protein, partial [candidate division Zixibacteria bacterium]|nr:helicase RepA family protein [candidate division Zixibacteria bacterium]